VIEGLILGALNHLLGQAEWARRQLRPFAGRQARFDMPPWQLGFAVSTEGRFEPVDEGEIDVTVTLPAETPLVALQGIDRAMAGAHVTGNAEFATALSFVLKNLRWDAEEDLSRVVGDIAAHRMVGGASRLLSWQREAAGNAVENLAEYLGEESSLLVPTRELTRFREDLADFTHRIEKLEARAKTRF
jgi:ubiquinone biosynthesis accessory factor UbiJ